MTFSEEFLDLIKTYEIDTTHLDASFSEVENKLNALNDCSKEHLLKKYTSFLQFVGDKKGVAYTKVHHGGAIFFAQSYGGTQANQAFGGFYFQKNGNISCEFVFTNLKQDEKAVIPESLKGQKYPWVLVTNEALSKDAQALGEKWLKVKGGVIGQMNERLIDSEKANFNESHEIEAPLNQILYGPPGTGKTYKLQKLQSNYTNDSEVASYDQWLSAKIENLSWMETIALILLDLGEATKVAQIIRHEFFQKKALINGRTIESLNATAWSSLQKFTIPESETVNYKNRSEPAIFDKTPDSKWLIVEDKKALVSELISLQEEIKTGPSEVEPVKRYTSITFHQSYGYEEFIEGLRANSTEDGAISYSIEAGEFIKLCRRAEQDPTNQYAIFIDEINRGNISKIFGELITLIEVDKRADCKHAMSVNLAYSGRSFSVPANVDIIGTMNTADRSLAMMDTALRRRFDFIEMMPKPELFNNKRIKGIELTELLATLNKRIEALYDREHTLGHAFLFPAYNEQDEDKAFELLKAAFKNKIIPLLEEYFYDDWNKIRLVLGDNQKSDEIRFVKKHNESYDSLFGSEHGLETYEESKTCYTLMAFDGENSVWDNPQAYIAVYTSIK
ncbi:McrB family protein [Aliivibrio fischeri]|uniref:McrB family protein n=1 Tax=Aliivibrio fischeri TaxID=668 RepID=UPI000907E38E|nr:AAA family ATPase [Aliivibrio fischeri]